MNDSVAQPLLRACGLPAAWAGTDAWRILQIGAPDVLAFLHVWAAWRKDPKRPRMLHYVSISGTPADMLQPVSEPLPDATLEPLVNLLALQCSDLMAGFQRLSFDEGHVLLTLCIGPLKAMLREQSFVADTVFCGGPLAPSFSTPDSSGWDAWTVKALARCCRRGTAVAARNWPIHEVKLMQQGGFDLTARDEATVSGSFSPRWQPGTTRRMFAVDPVAPGTCAVIGAGLAGASVAAALARRGWQVRVLDAATTPAQGASGLPAGLMVPQVSTDNSPRSRLAASGLRMMRHEAARLLTACDDWAPTGVMERREDGAELWHAAGAWVKPARLVKAWLAQSGVTFIGASQVAALERESGDWILRDSEGHELARARHVILAAAGGTVTLLDHFRQSPAGVDVGLCTLPAVSEVAGQVSCGVQTDSENGAMPPFPVNGSGSLIPSVPLDGGLAWYAGATYEPVATASEQVIANAHRANFRRLNGLQPAAALALQDQFTTQGVRAWRNSRLVASNRLPVVGPLTVGKAPRLWICAALGSRGLTMAALCAEFLAARLSAEPWPLEASLAAAIDSMRSKPAMAHKEY